MTKKKSDAKNFSMKQADNKRRYHTSLSELPQKGKAGSMKEPPANNKKQWLALALLSVLTFAAFYPSLKCEFTNWDDGTYVTENPMIWKLDGKAIKEIFTTPVSLNYHPLTMLSLAIDYKFSKLNPYRYHLVNVLWHILNVLLLFVFVQKLVQGLNQRSRAGFSPDPFYVALIASALWAIHPMRVESVTWVAERKDVMYVFFFFLSIIFYLRWIDSRRIVAMVLCFLFFVCSLLSKGMGVILPVVLVLIDWFYGDVKTMKQFGKTIFLKTHFFLLAFVFGVIAFKIQSQGAIAAMETFTLFQRLTFGCYGFIMYINKFFIPVNLSAFYPYPFTDTAGNIPTIYYFSPFIVLTIAAGIIFLLVKTEFTGKIIAFGFSFYFIALALVLQFLSVGSVIMADRYSYLAYVGLVFIIGYYYEFVRKFFGSAAEKAFTVALIGAIAVLSYLTFERSKVWTNAETLWTDALEQFPFIEIAYENRGIYYKDHLELDKMLKDYEFVTQKLHSRNEKIWSNLGNLYGLQKKFDKSLEAYSKAIEYNPQNASTYLNRAITFSMMGQYTKSLPDFDKAIELDPNVALTYKNRAYTHLQLGEFEKSISDYDRALELYSYDTLSYLNRGISKFNAKKYLDAISDFNTFIQMSPNNAQAYYNISVSYNSVGNFPDALKNALKAQQLGMAVSSDYLNSLKLKSGK